MTSKPVLLFQGDSITDCQRNKQDPHHLGAGYVNMVAAALTHDHPERGLVVYNRGISGNRSCDLLGRWDVDALDLKPTFFSLFIGINNTWRRFDRNDPTPAEVFEAELLQLLERTFAAGVSPANSILMEPFLLDAPAGSKTHWFEDLTPKQAAVRNAARKYGTHFLPLQSLFAAACSRAPTAHWAHDGVHPSPAGHHLIAKAWLAEMTSVVCP
jgi:acyl-CoA thioesterase-1